MSPDLVKLLKEIISETEVVPDSEEFKDKNIFKAPKGYVVTGRTIDPETGRSETTLVSEPQLLKYATELRRMKKDMKYFQMLPDDEPYDFIKSEALSITTSLGNAEGKLRQLYEKVQWVTKFKK